MRRFKTISAFHQFRQLPAPEHPLISVVEIDRVLQTQGTESMTWCYDFYAIGLKRVSFSHHINFRYGQQPYDFNEGILSFVAPNQVMSLSIDTKQETTQSGWLLLVHPDFLWTRHSPNRSENMISGPTWKIILAVTIRKSLNWCRPTHYLIA